MIQRGSSMRRRKRRLMEFRTAITATPELSGKVWVSRFPGSVAIDDLKEPFRSNVRDFVAALKAAAAKVDVNSTLRSRERAYLMHWSWMLSRDEVLANKIPSRVGVSIIWDHGDAAASRKAAADMVAGYGMSADASETSLHFEGRAVDMKISWSGTLMIKDRTGAARQIASLPRDGMNKDLSLIGKTYGVVKANFPGDPPHWSDNGS